MVSSQKEGKITAPYYTLFLLKKVFFYPCSVDGRAQGPEDDDRGGEGQAGVVQTGRSSQAQHPQGAHQRSQLQGEHGHPYQVSGLLSLVDMDELISLKLSYDWLTWSSKSPSLIGRHGLKLCCHWLTCSSKSSSLIGLSWPTASDQSSSHWLNVHVHCSNHFKYFAKHSYCSCRLSAL
jgi:hypothetical protein